MTPRAETDVRDRRRDVATPRRSHAAASGLAVAVALAVLFAAWTWFIAGPLDGTRIDQSLNQGYEIRQYADVLRTLDRIGQRAICLPILGAVALVLAWRHRSTRPVLIAVSAVVAVNLLVLILKVWLGRGAPLEDRPGFFISGQMYPSGHASNIVGVYGTAVYLVWRYTSVSKLVRVCLAAAVVFAAVLMTTVSVVLRWHWFSDLIAGYLVGGVVLAATVAIDLAVPFRSGRRASAVEVGPTADDPP